MSIETMKKRLEDLKLTVEKWNDVPQHITNDLNYMEKCINKGDAWGAYHIYGTVVQKMINFSKNY